MINLLFCGDIFLANTTFTKKIGLGAKISDLSSNEKIDSLYKLAKNCDIVFCNLETPLTKNQELAKNSSFIGYSIIPQLLINSNVNIVSIANNHILDHGIEKFQETIEILKRFKLTYIGEYKNGLSNIAIFNNSGIRIGFAAFNEVDLHKINNPNLFAELNKNTIKLTLQKMSTFSIDIKVLSFHWGNEYINIPSPHQIELGHFAIDNGANIVVGHHPHVIQPIENYRNGLIMYSLGNCIFDFLHSKEVREGIAVKVKLDNELKMKYEVFQIHLKEGGYFSISEIYKSVYYNNVNNILKLYNLDPEGYFKKYKKLLKKNRLIERIKMKVYFLKLFFMYKSNYRIILLQNFFNYNFKKIKMYIRFLI